MKNKKSKKRSFNYIGIICIILSTIFLIYYFYNSDKEK